jgi:uncharacterized radical SAM protein YgiQ
MRRLGYAEPDFVIVSGEAYVDHPTFGAALIGRVLEREGYKVCILPLPDYRSADDFRRFGKPRLGFMVTGGSVDSMVANYTAEKRRRRTDALAPGGRTGLRPDRAVIVYANRCREAYKDVPIILGGIEASLRRFAHYDYWSDKVRRSILLDAKADLLIYGMGEKAVIETAAALASGTRVREIDYIDGTVYRTKNITDKNTIILPSPDTKEAYSESHLIKSDNNEHIGSRPLAEPYPDGIYIVQNIPQPPLTTGELDAVYELPFMYDAHPIYQKQGEEIPALHEIKFSISHVRGCYGGCAFCAIAYHQGRIPTGRSTESVVKEAEKMTHLKDFKGYIHDLGGPTANISGPACKKQTIKGTCRRRYCLYPEPCKNLGADHKAYIDMLQRVAKIPGIKKVFIRSGIRYDLVLADKKHGEAFAKQLVKHNVSGQLKVAPEHIAPGVLK